jgi:hypothetical protein
MGDNYSVGSVRKRKPQPLNHVQWLRLPLSNGLNQVGVSHPSPDEGNISSFRNFVFCVFRIRTMDEVQKRSNPECHTPLSEPSWIYLFLNTNSPVLLWNDGMVLYDTDCKHQTLFFMLFIPHAHCISEHQYTTVPSESNSSTYHFYCKFQGVPLSEL